jgi:hypothetical protein
MNPTDERVESENTPRKREYVKPKLERLGTIGELTRGEGANNQFDGTHPPGQNKSII